MVKRKRLQTQPDLEYFSWLHVDGKVRPEIFHQHKCNCCTAIAGAHATESAFAIFNEDPLENISVRHLIDCMHTNEQVEALMDEHGTQVDVQGCYPQPINEIYEHMIEKGVMIESDYPHFTAERKECRVGDRAAKKIKKIKDYDCIGKEACVDDELIISCLKKQPLVGVVRIKGGFTGWKKDGIYTAHSLPPLKNGRKRVKKYHPVLITGCGKDPRSEKYYFEIKNSGGRSWGKNGIGKVCQTRSLPIGYKPVFKFISFPVV